MTSLSGVSVEESTVRAFVLSNRRMRWLEGLQSAKRRQQTLNRLHDGRDFRGEFATELQGSVAKLAEYLSARRAATDCYVLGGAADGRFMPLAQALIAASGSDGALLLVCRPGQLMVHFPEAPGVPVIYERPAIGHTVG